MRIGSFIATSLALFTTAAAPLAAQRADTSVPANMRSILEAIDRGDPGLWGGQDDNRGRERDANRDDRGAWDRNNRDDRRSREERERALERWRRDREKQVRSCERDLWRRVRDNDRSDRRDRDDGRWDRNDRDDDRWDGRGRDVRGTKERIHRYCERRVWERNPRIFDGVR